MSDGEEVQFQARVEYDFTGESTSELSVKAGEIVTVLKDDEPWSLIRKANNEEGYVPSNYITQIGEDDVPEEPEVMPLNNVAYRNDTEREAPVTPTDPLPPAPKGGRFNNLPNKFTTKLPNFGSSLPTSSLDGTVAYNLLAASCEWWCCIALFFSGVFSVLWGSQDSPEDEAAQFFGAMQCIIAAVLLVYFALFREFACCCNPEQTALVRGGFLLLTSITGFAALPMGAIGGGACLIASFANFYAFFKNSATLDDEGKELEWLSMGFDMSKINCKNSSTAFIFFAFYGVLNWLFYLVGLKIGQDRIDDELAENRLEVGDMYSRAEGFGVIISFNFMMMFLFSLFGFQILATNWSKTRSGPEEDCITRGLVAIIDWLFVDTRILFLHRTFAALIMLATIGHCVANFQAYEDSGPARDYVEVFGRWPLISGILIILLMIPIYSVANPVIKESAREVFNVAHGCWVVVFLLLFLHGKADPFPWNSNFWKFMLGPSILYLLDVIFRYGGLTAMEIVEGA